MKSLPSSGRSYPRRGRLHLAASALLCVLWISGSMPQARGAIRIWDGSDSVFWSSPRNWVFDAAPGAGDLPIFPPGPSRVAMTNNLATNSPLHSLLFTGPGYRVDGNPLVLTNGLHASHEAGTTRILIPTMFTGPSSLITASNANALLVIEGPVKYPVTGLTFDVTGRIQVSNTVSQIVPGAQHIVKVGPGTLELAASNTFGGTLLIRDGTVFAKHDAALGNAAGQGSVVSNGATLLIGGGLDLLESSITLAGSLVLSTIGGGGAASTIQGALSFVGTNAIIDVPVTYLELSGPLSGTDGFRLMRGDLVVTGTSPTFTGPVVLQSNSRLTANGQQPLAPVHLNGGWLTGDGAVGPIMSLPGGGRIQFSGVLSTLACGSVTLSAATIYHVPISKQGAPVSSKLDAHGTVSLNSCALELAVNSQTLLPGESVTLIQNDGVDPVSGNFAGLPEGAELTNALTQFRISYAAGDGNDVVLTVVPHTRSWDGGAVDDNWQSDANWNPNVDPHVGDNLVFPAGAARLSNSNNFGLQTSFNSLVLEGAGYTLRGNSILLNAGLSATYPMGTSTVTLPIRLASNQTFRATSGAVLSLTTNVETNGKELTLDGGGELRLSGAVSQIGSLVKTGAGLAVLSRSNTYSGTTLVSGGILQITANAALGSTNGTTVNPGAALSVNPGLTVAEALTLAGVLRHNSSGAATSSWTGPILLAGPAAVMEVESAPLIVTGAISGSGSLTKQGPGLLLLTATNTFAGATVLSEGTLMINGAQPQSIIQFNGGALLGRGVAGHVFAAGTAPKTIDPGASVMPGSRTLSTSNLVLNSFTTFGPELDGDNPGVNHDQLMVRGSVNLNNCRFVPVAGPALAIGQVLRVIDNDGSDSVIGTFNGVPEGGKVTANSGLVLQVSYRGGDGNDVQVTVENPPSTMTSLSGTPEGFVRIRGQGLPNVTYTLEASSNLLPDSWTAVTADLADAAGVYEFIDVDAGRFPQRFYRVLSP